MEDRAKELLKRSAKRFSARASLDNLRQEIAQHFVPWHASFTSMTILGEDYASQLVDGTPLIICRDFVGQVGAMLRPPGKQWFWHRTQEEDINNDVRARSYLDWRSRQMMRIVFDRVSGAARSLKQADEFFCAFGEAVLCADLNATRDSLRIRSYHVKDAVWSVGPENRVDTIARKEKISARNLKARFSLPGDKIHAKVEEAYDKDPDTELEIEHHVLPSKDYKGSDKAKMPFSSVWIDVANDHIIRDVQTETFRYVVPRWMSLPHSPHGISLATTVAIPDARLIQQQALAILEAAEKQINPPLIAVEDAIRGDIGLGSREITWVDKAYDDRTGDPLRPLELGKNFGLGVESLLRTEQQLTRAFFLDVLRLPDTRRSKSTVEVQFLIDEYIRAALPLFAPMQSEYNEAFLFECDKLIELAGGYNGRAMPEEVKRAGIQYQWDNPLSDMQERMKAQTVGELSQLAQTVAALEASTAQSPALQQIDTRKMFREAALGIGASQWMLSEDDQKRAADAAANAGQMKALIDAAPNIAKVVDSGVNAASAMAMLPKNIGIPLLPAPQ
jgi:hypothetical protein